MHKHYQSLCLYIKQRFKMMFFNAIQLFYSYYVI